MLIEMKVGAIAEDAVFKTPIIILKALESDRCLPIWVGPFEGQAIESGIRHKESVRPLPYDIIIKMLNHLNAKYEKVVINNIVNNTFYATIFLNVDGILS